MNTIFEITKLVCAAHALKLENRGILEKYSAAELAEIYNGIGPDSFPAWLRGLISELHPTLGPAALIHDVEWHESDGSRAAFAASNARLHINGCRAAKGRFPWFDPRRYAVMNQARRFGNICQIFGWHAWTSPCECAVCKHRKDKSC